MAALRINDITPEELRDHAGFGLARARRILTIRDQLVDGFRSEDDILDGRGLGPSTVRDLGSIDFSPPGSTPVKFDFDRFVYDCTLAALSGGLADAHEIAVDCAEKEQARRQEDT